MKTGPRVTISHGNSKMGMSIPSVSLPAPLTCVKDAPCKKDCYDSRSYKRWPSVLKARLNNFNILKEDRAEYFLQINEYIAKNKPQFFRWHVGGDIVDQEYFYFMCVVAHTAPDTKFLCFTKRHDLDFTRAPHNLTVVLSMWPGFGDLSVHTNRRRAWCDNGQEARIPADALECPGNCETCGACWNLPSIGRDVFFKLH